MIDPNIEALLLDLNSDQHAHTDGTLIDHLTGTCRLLESWENDPEVCLGGLFHSIYGTQSYRMQAASIDDRSRIRRAIGVRAERMAYLICASRRTQFIDEFGKENASLFDRIHEEHIPVSQEDLRDLIEIEVAYYVEFMTRTSFTLEELDALGVRVGRVSANLTKAAVEALHQAIAKKRLELGT